MTETFKKKLWRAQVVSSRGFSVRVLGRTGVEYKDGAGSLRINAETMAGPGMAVVVYAGSIPDTPRRPRRQVLDDLYRAFAYAGWTLDVEQ